jgi:hypothetical protein
MPSRSIDLVLAGGTVRRSKVRDSLAVPSTDAVPGLVGVCAVILGRTCRVAVTLESYNQGGPSI